MDILTLLIVIILIAWLLGAFVFNLGSLVHLLLVVAVVIVLVRLLRGQRPL